MTLGYTRGEIILVVFIFGLIYMAGLLPKIAARIAGKQNETGTGGTRGED